MVGVMVMAKILFWEVIWEEIKSLLVIGENLSSYQWEEEEEEEEVVVVF